MEEGEKVDRGEEDTLTPFALEVLARIGRRERRRRARTGLLAVGGTVGALALGTALWPWLTSDDPGESAGPRARLMAVREIGSNVDAVDDLVALARDEDPSVSLAAGHYLTNAVGAARAAARVATQSGGRSGIEELHDAMAFEAELARLAEKPMTELRGAEAGLAIIGIRHPDPNVRVVAWRLVSRMVPADLESPEFDAELEQTLSHGTSQDRESASLLIVDQRRPTLYPEIAALARNMDPRARSLAARRLGELRDPVWVSALLPLLDDVDAKVRLDAAIALAALGVDRAVEDLVAMAKGDGSGRPWALRALHEVGEPRVRDLAVIALGDGTPIVLMEACTILGDLRAQVDVAVLKPLLTHENVYVRMRAAYALSANGGQVDPSPLLPFLDADNPQLRAHAARLLLRLDDESATPAAAETLPERPGSRSQ